MSDSTYSRYKVGYEAGFVAGVLAVERIASQVQTPLVSALRIQTANNHLIRHGGSAVDWETCEQQSCSDARAALAKIGGGK